MSIKTLFEDIADAIREKSGSSDAYTPTEMPDAILDIPGGGMTVALALMALNATANTYTDPFGYTYYFTCSSLINNNDNRQPYLAFNTIYGERADTKGDYSWHPNSGSPQWLQIALPSAVKVKKFRLKNRAGNGSNYKPTAFKLQGSNDGSSWADLGSYAWNDSTSYIDCVVSSPDNYLYYRIYETAVSASYGVIAQWRFLEVEQ